MADIFVTGHRNPDTDSIVAALAYANLRNSLGDREYKAVRIGGVNDETRRMLNRFGFDAPEYVKNLRTQVRDLDYDVPPELNHSVTMERAWRIMSEDSISTMPILNDDGTLYGMLSAGDIATYDMQSTHESYIHDLPVFNLLSTLEGTSVNEFANPVNSVSGNVIITLPSAYFASSGIDPDLIAIVGDQPDLIDRFIEAKVACIIICQSEIKPEWAAVGAPTCIISTPLDCRRVARLIYQAMPVKSICKTDDIISFRLSDYLDDVRETLIKSRYRAYPVVDEKGLVVGTISRYHLLRPKRKRVVLVDHNEASQSVPGLEQVDILAIIDHHRLADIQTAQPVSVRNEPVGSTNTIITAMYQENGVIPSPRMAGLMCAAILSDTVLFKSPTCTKKDIAMAERLARIANVSIDELGKDLFTAGSNADKNADELFRTDYKQFHISGMNIGVSQITCVDSSAYLSRKGEFLQLMDKLKAENDFDMIILMLTDVLNEGSYLLYLGSDDIIQQAFSTEPEGNQIFLPGVMSRKKQVIPMLTALWG